MWDPATAVEIGVQTPFGRLAPAAVELNRGAGVEIVQYRGEHGATVRSAFDLDRNEVTSSEVTAHGATTQPVETVVAVLAATRKGASINAAAKASGINYRTAQRIVEAAAAYRQRQLAAVG